MNLLPKIGWIQWQNPYSLTDQEKEDSWDEDSDLEYVDDYEESKPKNFPNVHVVITPMGAVPLAEHSEPQKVFNLWMAHTNFDITTQIAKEVEKVPGVETLDIYSRYRMRVGIGKMFNSKGVIQEINASLYKLVKESKTNATKKFF